MQRHVVAALLRAPLRIVGNRQYTTLVANSSSVLGFATVAPQELSAQQLAQVYNLVDGEWTGSSQWEDLVDPLNGKTFIKVPSTSKSEVNPFIKSLRACPKSGLHNPLKNPERYLLYGDVSAKTAHALSRPETADFFAKLIQRVSPKSYTQALAEVTVTQKFFENFSGDQVRFLARSFVIPGNHLGQQSTGLRWPYGPVAIITPFNFPLEIPALQLMGALYMGNKPLLKVDSKVHVGPFKARLILDADMNHQRLLELVSIVMDQFLRLLHSCGLPLKDVDFLNSDGPTMNHVLVEAEPRMTLFTGSSRVAEKLAGDLKGKIKLEDAGFDWKILGPDVQEVDYVAWVCDQDAYACSGQKCSAQSILFVHENWTAAGFFDKLKILAGSRKLENLTVGPVLTVTTKRILDHVEQVLAIPGSRLAFGGKPLINHSIPEIYGAVEPTAVYVPLEEILKEDNFDLVTTEIFGPFQPPSKEPLIAKGFEDVWRAFPLPMESGKYPDDHGRKHLYDIVTEYKTESLHLVLEACEKMHANLTAAVVSNDPHFLQEVLGSTVNGTTYAGIRARTTGAPQNHWFGPCGDPRGAGIGTPEAIKLVWSSHREIIQDIGPVDGTWTTPPPT